MDNVNKTILCIVVTFNGEDWVDYCFSSLMRSNYPIDIFCVDNNSSDKTVELIRRKYKEVNLFESKTNLGFGKANNIGLKKCIDDSYDYAFLLNQDACIDEGTIKKLIDMQIIHSEYGILSPIHRSMKNNSLDFNFSHYLNSYNTKSIVEDFILGNEIKDIYQTNFVNAAIWLISKKCVTTLKGFDPDFPHYGEDKEYIFRAIKNNFKVGIVPNALGNHARYKVKKIKVNEDFSNIINREYVKLLFEYKKNPSSMLSKKFYFFRRMIISLFDSLLMVDLKMFRVNFSVYRKIICNLHL